MYEVKATRANGDRTSKGYGRHKKKAIDEVDVMKEWYSNQRKVEFSRAYSACVTRDSV